jgi:hypothetical protein
MNNSNDLELLRQKVEQELSKYSYSFSDGAIGKPWTQSRIDEQLALMRRSLVAPYLIQVKMEQPFELIGTDGYEIRSCAVVADANDGYFLVFDFDRQEFLLTQLWEGQALSIGVRGDAVGCFMSR